MQVFDSHFKLVNHCVLSAWLFEVNYNLNFEQYEGNYSQQKYLNEFHLFLLKGSTPEVVDKTEGKHRVMPTPPVHFRSGFHCSILQLLTLMQN